MDTNIQRLCVDLGNGGFKGAVVRVVKPAMDGQPEGREIVTAHLPSKVGVGSTDMGALSLVGLEKKKRGEDALRPIQISSDDGVYLVGANVERNAQVLERFDAGKYTNSPELRAIMRALLAQLINGGSSDIAIVAALPVEVLAAADSNETIKGIEQWLVGEHTFTYDGKPARVNVRAVKAIAQPVGAFFAWGLDLNGNWVRDESDLTGATVAVLDSGFNTLDLLAVKRGRIEKRFTGGDDLGVRVAAEEIANALNARFNIKWSMHEVDELIREYLDKRKVMRVFAGKKTDLTPVVAQALNTLATRTVDYVQRTWRGASDFSYVLMVGGGALALDGQIKRHIPHATIPADPVTGEQIDPVFANAIGGAKIALRPATFKGLG